MTATLTADQLKKQQRLLSLSIASYLDRVNCWESRSYLQEVFDGQWEFEDLVREFFMLTHPDADEFC